MKLNEHTAVSSARLFLVPYDAHHVPTYHEWMADPAIQEATASEPLTLEEEYENQVSWRTSGDKLTFILCLRGTPGEDNNNVAKGEAARAGQVDTPEKMIGDINLFLTPWDEDEVDETETGETSTAPSSSSSSYVNGEIDIMIASAAHRRLGLGREAVSTLLSYIRRHVEEILGEYAAFTSSDSDSTNAIPAPTAGQRGVQQQQQRKQKFVLRDLVAKINAGNEGSIALFKSLGFRQKGEVNYFGELLLVLDDFYKLREDKESESEVYGELVWDRTGL
ncbi:GNAT domain-containing protein [Microdochium trichocladiopsis]|uniref:GNAT domain-containing protein n=1 Tax=Microdochium trichocladiopsis TaxID=1682393 RepID=A0A9P8YC25_9PEZI|nr:GNAT domain-containing protein [Microdochium trichocladiopsis]KAH7033442.1 GNAT domain-containing protein [Microdochium trichocladiopsis]